MLNEFPAQFSKPEDMWPDSGCPSTADAEALEDRAKISVPSAAPGQSHPLQSCSPLAATSSLLGKVIIQSSQGNLKGCNGVMVAPSYWGKKTTLSFQFSFSLVINNLI